MIPPIGVVVQVRSKAGKWFALWFPLLLLWLPLLLLILLLMPLVALAQFILAASGRTIRLIALLGGVWGVLAALRGMHVELKNHKDKAHILIHFS
jgi:hypothetical protein